MSPLATTATEDLWTAWSLDPVAFAAAGVAVAFFLQGWRRLHRRRPQAAPWTRIPLFLAGVAIVLVGRVFVGGNALDSIQTCMYNSWHETEA